MKNAGQARRLLAIAAVLEGSSREEVARAGGMDRADAAGRVIRFNAQGWAEMINIRSPACRAS